MLFVDLSLTLPALILLCLCNLLPIWLVLGRSHVFIRMPLFLIANALIGLILCFAYTDSARFDNLWESRHVVLCSASGVSLAAGIMRTTPLYFRIPSLLFGVLMLIGLLGNVTNPHFEWMTGVTVATTFWAIVVAALPVAGFRIVSLTDGVSNLELEKHTGRDIDEWIALLDATRCSSLRHAEILSFLRQYGFDLFWQKTVTVAYERALGRYSVGQTATGNSQVVMQRNESDLTKWFSRLKQPQFTVWQLMLGTFCAVCLFAFLGWFDSASLKFKDYRYGIPVAIAISILVVPVLGCLAVRRFWRRLGSASALALVVAGSLPYSLGLTIDQPRYWILLVIELGYVGMLVASLVLVRHKGYRLVRLVDAA